MAATAPFAVVFADEAGIPLVAGVLTALNIDFSIVVDEARPDAAACARGTLAAKCVLGHPKREARAAFVERIRDMRAGLGVISSYSRILWPELLDVFPLGIVNLHNGPLPEYRGANVLQWSIISGAAETAVTLHYVDAGIDSGPVIDAIRVPIEPIDTALTLRARLSVAGAELLRRWLPRLLLGRVPARAQDESEAVRWPRRYPDDGRIDWSKSDEEISRLTRALVPPWPSAFYDEATVGRVEIKRPLAAADVAALRGRLGK